MSKLTVSKLGRQFGLSRSTLLYYDRVAHQAFLASLDLPAPEIQRIRQWSKTQGTVTTR